MRRSRPDARRAWRGRGGGRPPGRLWLLVVSAGTLFLLLGASSALALTLSLPPNAGAPPGSSTPVPLSVDDASGMLGTDIVISYDPAVALARGVSRTPLSAGQTLTVNLSSPGTIRISLFGSTPLAGGGVLLDLSFDSVGAANSQTVLDLVTASVNEGAIPAALVDGRYCVQGLTAEVRSLGVDPGGPGSGAEILEWLPDAYATGYNVYRAGESDLGDLRCLLPGVSGPPVSDEAVPDAGAAFFYLVTARNCRGESTLGFASSGDERVNRAPCP